MAIPLFWRLILGYSTILLLTIGISLYSILQLSAFSKTARAAIDTDYRMIAQQETLTDALLSEVRYGGKYLINQSPASYDQFVQFKSDFLRYLSGLKASKISGDIVAQVSHVEQLHQGYHDLFAQEVRYLKARQPYAQSRYQQEREKILDNTLRELVRLKEQLQKNVQDKLEQMGRSARAARNIAIGSTIMLMIFGTALSLNISATITNSLLALKRKTQGEVSDPISIVPVSPIPEVQELSEALTQRIERLNQAAETNVNLVQRVTEELAARLIALKAKLSDLASGEQTTMGRGETLSIATMIADTDRLVQRCAELNAAAVAQAETKNLHSRAATQIRATSDGSDKNSRSLTFSLFLPGDNPLVGVWLRDRCVKILISLARHFRPRKTAANKPGA